MIERMLPRLHKSSVGLFAILSCSSAFAAAPQLTVQMYAVSPVSPEVLDLAAPEAARILRALPVGLNWVNCSAPSHPEVCDTSSLPTDLRVRLVPKALASASRNTLGMAMWSDTGSSAVLFYDRALSIRGPGPFLPQILGRALAHEVVHLLLGTTSHGDRGLMKQEWTAKDLYFDSGSSLELSPAGIAAIKNGAEMRIASADGEGKRVPVGLVAKPRSYGPRIQ
jgi:hypothetical protein